MKIASFNIIMAQLKLHQGIILTSNCYNSELNKNNLNNVKTKIRNNSKEINSLIF